ncbi:MAG TPA: hypothetical protein VJ179_04330, partial [Patescibacteria group bacterium]|nr:hypothetical protein [Patescibacteria group bacterium]
MKLRAALVLLGTLFIISLPFFHPIYADELEEIGKKIDELTKAREMSIAATKPLEGTLLDLEKQISSIQSQLSTISKNLTKKEKELSDLEFQISEEEDRLVYQQDVFEKRVRSYYIRSYSFVPFLFLFSSEGAQYATRELAYQQAAAGEDKRVIEEIVLSIQSLEEKKQEAKELKAKLESEKSRLAVLQQKLDTEAAFFR